MVCAHEITDEGLVHLEGLSALKFRWFGYIRISDQGMKHLSGLSKLTELHLGIGDKSAFRDGSEFNDAGLVYLSDLKSLRKLTFARTNITGDGITKLKKDLPDCEIERK
jgi:hypothetical protein